MRYDQSHPHRHSIRLQGYDYRLDGAYFVTIVCKDRALLFEDGTLRDIVDSAWRWLGQQYSHAELDEYVVTKRINRVLGTPGAVVWQRNYWERIIRDEDEMNRIRQYVIENPARWEEDLENPAARIAISKTEARR